MPLVVHFKRLSRWQLSIYPFLGRAGDAGDDLARRRDEARDERLVRLSAASIALNDDGGKQTGSLQRADLAGSTPTIPGTTKPDTRGRAGHTFISLL